MTAAPSPGEDGHRIERRPASSMLALQEALGGRYWIERELGKGGMGIVYLAWEPALERLVALKILPPDAPEGRGARFLQEARLAARLRHDHIVPIYAADAAGPFVYYTMQYIEGETLARRILTGGALPAGDATRILHDVARAVNYAHEKGVIHRDLKPSNILIARDNARAYVADFGLARALNDGPVPDGGHTFGTCHYASPEQAAGLRTDHRSDIYALGVMGYVMATGQPLFSGTPTEILEQHVSRPAPALGVLGRHLDTTLSRAVRRCLAKNPADRFQTAGELARALSLAPELRSDLPPKLREFLSRLRLQSRSAPAGVVLGLGAIGVLDRSIRAGAWGMAATAAGVLGLMLVSPIAGALPAARRLLAQGYGRADIIHALDTDLDRQREQLASRWGRVRDAVDRAWRRIFVGALGVFGFGVVTAVTDAPFPNELIFGSMVGGTVVSLVVGGVLVWRERRRNELWGHRWLWFWHSPLGKWTVRLAGVGLDSALGEPELPEPGGAVVLPPPLEPAAALSSDVSALAEVLDRSESCVRRARGYLAASLAPRAEDPGPPGSETLERQLVVLEALVARFRSAEVGGDGHASLAADLAAATEACDMVEALLEAAEWRG